MTFRSITQISTCLVLAATGSVSLAYDTCRDGDRVYTPTVEFTRGPDHVFFVGMIHAGPKAFYDHARRTVDAYTRRINAPAVILTEFFTCDTETVNVKAGAKISLPELRALSASNPRAGLNAMSDRVSFDRCDLDVDGRTLRPAFLTERNRTGCATINANGFGCQWGDFHLPTLPTIAVRSGDLKLDTEPPATQILASMSYRDWSWATPTDADAGTKVWNVTFDSFILDHRNTVLVANTMRALESVHHVILPWGAAHLDGIKQTLIAFGFVQSRLGAVPYSGPDNLGRWAEFDLSYPDLLKDAVPMAGHCAPAPAVLPESRR